jgi:phosphatidate cytidylyltransferase
MIWSEPSYQFFLILSAALVLGAGLLLVGVRKKPQAAAIWRAYRPWLIMAPLVLVAVGCGRNVLVGALFLLSIFSIKEFAKATGLYQDWWFMGALYLGLLGIYGAVWADWFGLFTAMPVWGVSALFLIPILRNEYRGMIQRVGLSAIAVIYLGWFLAHLAFLESFPQGFAYLLYLAIGTELNDASAYVSGKFLGKHLLISNISPKKTIEGSLGALVVTALYTWGVSPWLPSLSAPLLILSVFIIWLGGTFGDLVISFVKRDIGIKDMGSLIPGHGGLLDRVDSLIFVAPIYFHMLKFFIANPGEFQ